MNTTKQNKAYSGISLTKCEPRNLNLYTKHGIAKRGGGGGGVHLRGVHTHPVFIHHSHVTPLSPARLPSTSLALAVASIPTPDRLLLLLQPAPAASSRRRLRVAAGVAGALG